MTVQLMLQLFCALNQSFLTCCCDSPWRWGPLLQHCLQLPPVLMILVLRV